MRHEFLIKTDCLACLGVIGEVIKKIDGVKETKLDLEAGKVIIEYKGGLSRGELSKILKEKTGYQFE
jgi:copper chaperone CopZ